MHTAKRIQVQCSCFRRQRKVRTGKKKRLKLSTKTALLVSFGKTQWKMILNNQLRRSDRILGIFYHDSLRAQGFQTLIKSVFEIICIWIEIWRFFRGERSYPMIFCSKYYLTAKLGPQRTVTLFQNILVRYCWWSVQFIQCWISLIAKIVWRNMDIALHLALVCLFMFHVVLIILFIFRIQLEVTPLQR